MGPLVSISALFGLFAGAFISRYTHEELKQGRSYIRFAQHVLVSLWLVLLFWNWPMIALGIGAVFLCLFMFFRFNHSIWIAPLFALSLTVESTIVSLLYFITLGSLQPKLTSLLLVSLAYALIAYLPLLIANA